MWWGVLCHQRAHGQLAQAMFDDAIQLYGHAEALMRPLDNVGGRAFDVGSAVIGVLGLFGLAVAPPVGVAITIVGAAKVVGEPRGGRAFQDLAGEPRRGRPSGRRRTVRSTSRTRSTSSSRGSGRITRDRPMIVVVDDAHFADESLVRIVDGLAHGAMGACSCSRRRGRHIWMRRAVASLRHLDAGGGRPVDGYLRDLDELADADVEEIVQADLPAAAGFGRHSGSCTGRTSSRSAPCCACRGSVGSPRTATST